MARMNRYGNPQYHVYTPHQHVGFRSEWARQVRAAWAAYYAANRRVGR